MFRIPGRSYEGALKPLTIEERDSRDRLRSHVGTLAGTIGERNLWRYEALRKAAAYLEQELVASRYDLKRLYRLILNSTTYQLSWIAPSKDPKAAAQFAYYPLRPLEAEVLIDAVCQITGTTEQYSSQIPEPFTFIPEDQRSIALADASISSAFLETFGRSPRDTGLLSERNTRPTAAQRLHLLNSSHIRQKLERGPKLEPLLRGQKGNPRDSVVRLYLTFLSREPTEDELKIVQDARGGGKGGRGPLADIAWALVNSDEFFHRH